ncbi:MAG: hypothetical protein M0R73_02590 [Dehalococcoidia bacterium]|nr:hypothetical protein [Dehalococcoidia bacterium]
MPHYLLVGPCGRCGGTVVRDRARIYCLSCARERTHTTPDTPATVDHQVDGRRRRAGQHYRRRKAAS